MQNEWLVAMRLHRRWCGHHRNTGNQMKYKGTAHLQGRVIRVVGRRARERLADEEGVAVHACQRQSASEGSEADTQSTRTNIGVK